MSGKLAEPRQVLTMNVNCDNALLPSIIHEPMNITIHVVSRLIANYKCSPQRRMRLKDSKNNNIVEL